MKKFLSLISFVFITGINIAQSGVNAPDFTSTDINGNTHNLYNYLNAGKLVILDVSTTWCGPCWGFHEAHYLKELYDEFGPNGTDDIVVLFYEADPATTLADLNGSGSDTQGDWITGIPYPIFNDSIIVLNQYVYGMSYPTVNLICPSGKMIMDDLNYYNDYSNQAQSLQDMRTVVLNYINTCTSLGLHENIELFNDVRIAPNPSFSSTTVSLNANSNESVSIKVMDVTGKEILILSNQLNEGQNDILLDLTEFEVGKYFVQIGNDNFVSKLIPIVKQ
jgi:thiol-disulfide isomerase/thioredoxin